MRVLDFDRRIIRRHSNRIEELWLRKLNFACVFELASRRLAGDSLGDVQHVWTPVATTGRIFWLFPKLDQNQAQNAERV